MGIDPRVHFVRLYLLQISFPVAVIVTRSLVGAGPSRDIIGDLSRKDCPKSLEFQRAHTPLRHSQFERELADHHDKAIVSWLLKGIQDGVKLGYNGPRN